MWQSAVIFMLFFTSICIFSYLVYKMARKLVEFFAVKANSNSQAYSGLDVGSYASSNRTLLIQKYVELQGNSSYLHRMKSSSFIAAPFLDALAERFSVRVEVQSCSFNNSECVTLLVLTGKDGKEYYIMASDSIQSAYNSKGDPRYMLPNSSQSISNFEEQIDDESYLRILKNFEIVYSSLYGDTNSDLVYLRDTMKEFEVDSVYYESVMEDQVRTYELTYDQGYSLIPDSIQVTRLTKTGADSLYAPVKIKYQGEDHTILASDAITQASIALSSSKNVYIWGIPGTGKTTMLDQIIARTFDDYDDVAIVRLTPTTFREIQSASGLSQFRRQIEHLDAEKVVFLMDEAESLLRPEVDGTHSEVASALLSLLDGALRKQLNCNTVLVFNAEPEILDQAVFRPGREGLSLRLGTLPKHIAIEGVKYLQKENPEKVFDNLQFEKVLAEENKDHTGKVYCPKNDITLAALVNCFSTKEETDHLIDSIRAAALAFNSEFKPAGTSPKKVLVNSSTSKKMVLTPLPKPVIESTTKRNKKRKDRKNFWMKPGKASNN